jgi:hypothetical protein
MALQQLGQRRRAEPVGEPQRPRVLGGRLPVGAERGRPPGGDRGVGEHGGGVARPVGMVGQPGGVRGGAGPGEQCGQGTAVQLRPATGRQRPLHGQAGQLVPEADPAGLPLEHPGGHALVHIGGCGTGRLDQQPSLHLRGHHRGRVQDLPGRWGQPGRPSQHRIRHGGRDRLIPGGEDLGDKERVPPGPLVQRARVQPVRAGQHRHRLAGQGRQPQPAHQGRAGQVAGEQLHRVQRADLVVPVGDHQQDGGRTEPAGKEPEQVQGGLVGPVDVLDHQHGRHPALPQPFEQGTEQHLPRCLLVEQLVELTTEGRGDVGQRAQRPRGGQRVTGTPQDPGGRPVPGRRAR